MSDQYSQQTIKQVVEDIDMKKMFLPALQRKFVWRRHQIEMLFDSLMRNYPLGMFLFWRLRRETTGNYVFYEFLTEYDERNPYNRRKTGAFLHPEIVGVLDGQQRLSSMYIGLMGTHTEKTPHKWVTSPDAYQKATLYLNVLSLPYEINIDDNVVIREEQDFEFRFLTEEVAASSVARPVFAENGTDRGIEAMFWMKVGDVLSWKDEPEYDRIIERFKDQCRTDEQRGRLVERSRLIRRGLQTLFKRIREDKLISYFEVVKSDLEDILKIFVRVNSGGTVLNKTDLLFSTIVATWDNGREQIEDLLKSINSKGDGFCFGNEFLMRCCLVLSDGPVVYKVNSFKAENVQKIRDQWPGIAEAISKTVDLLVEFGFNGSVLTSQNATIPIAYYFYKGGDRSKPSKHDIRKYLIHALLNGVFGSAQDQVISSLRNALRVEERTETGELNYRGRYSSFVFSEILGVKLPQQKSLAVNEDDIERFLQITKGASSFFVLSLLYPDLRYNEVVFHQDHIHPAAGFCDENFRTLAIPEDQWQEWLECRDRVPNLQLMNGRENISKNKTPLKVWIQQNMDHSAAAAFARENYFPDSVELDFGCFRAFFNQRKEVLRCELRKVLALTNDRANAAIVDWSDSPDEP